MDDDRAIAHRGWGPQRQLHAHVPKTRNGGESKCTVALLITAREDTGDDIVRQVVDDHPDLLGARIRTLIAEEADLELRTTNHDWGLLQGALLQHGGPEVMMQPVHCCYGEIAGTGRHYQLVKVYD